jgi:hypothetical protein
VRSGVSRQPVDARPADFEATLASRLCGPSSLPFAWSIIRATAVCAYNSRFAVTWGKSRGDIPQRPGTAVERFSGQALCKGDDSRRRGPSQTPSQVRRAIGEIKNGAAGCEHDDPSPHTEERPR